MSNKLTVLAREILAVEADLPFRMDYKREHLKVDDYEFYIFPQSWGSTALGFSGIGGQAITTANTIVCVPMGDQKCAVYFGGRFAYAVENSREFMEDVYRQNMSSVAQSVKYAIFAKGENEDGKPV